MKSIDEAGVEWHLSHPDADKEETWKAGANYVLDAIVGIINQPMNDYLVLEELWNTIEELRK